MDAQCLLGDVGISGEDEDVQDGEEGEQTRCCICCAAIDGKGLCRRRPLLVPFLCLKYVCKNKVFRECVRFFSVCIAVGILIIGVRKRESCPFEPAIPVFLLVDGSIIALHTAISTLLLCREQRKTSDPDVDKLDNLSILLKILILFLVLWNGAGSVWIYSAEKVVQYSDPVRTNYCDVTAYYVAFGLVTSAYFAVGAVVVFIFVTVASLYVYQHFTRSSGKKRQDIETNTPDNITHI